MKRHGPMIWGICRRVLGQEQDAEDALQATFLVLARQAAKIRKQESLASWLHGVALHMSKDARKADARRAFTRTKHPSQRRRPVHIQNFPGARPRRSWMKKSAACHRFTASRSCSAAWKTRAVPTWQGCSSDQTGHRLESRSRGPNNSSKKRLTKRGVELGGPTFGSRHYCRISLGHRTARFDGLTSRAAVETLASPGLASVSISPIRSDFPLVQGMMKGMALSQFKAMSLVVLVFGSAVACLRSAAPRWLPESTLPLMHRQIRSIRSSAELSRGQPGPDLPTRTDFFGDPLPVGAVARLGTIRFRQVERSAAIAFSPDGKSVAASGIGAVVHIWETATGKEISRFTSRPDSLVNFESISIPSIPWTAQP